MSLTAGFVLGSLIAVLGAIGLAAFALYLMERDGRERESRPVILRVDSYRARKQ